MKKGEKMKQITESLGRKPKYDSKEYKRLWARISRGTNKERKLQRTRHMSHSFNIANKNRKFCDFCKEEGRT